MTDHNTRIGRITGMYKKKKELKHPKVEQEDSMRLMASPEKARRANTKKVWRRREKYIRDANKTNLILF